MTGFGTLVPAERIPAPAGPRPNPSGSRGGTVLEAPEPPRQSEFRHQANTPGSPDKASEWFLFRKKDLATICLSALK